MRRERLAWTYLVITALLLAYGGYTAIYHHDKNRALFISGIVAFFIGLAMLIIYVVLRFAKKKKDPEAMPEEKKEEAVDATMIEPIKKVSMEKEIVLEEVAHVKAPRQGYSNRTTDVARGYVRHMGHGPVLEVQGMRIRDMRSNIYYRIDGSYVYSEQGGLSFELQGNRIKSLAGAGLFELQGDQLRRVFGGAFASVNGAYITTYDGLEKYECPSDLNRSQLLVVAALLFNER